MKKLQWKVTSFINFIKMGLLVDIHDSCGDTKQCSHFHIKFKIPMSLVLYPIRYKSPIKTPLKNIILK